MQTKCYNLFFVLNYVKSFSLLPRDYRCKWGVSYFWWNTLNVLCILSVKERKKKKKERISKSQSMCKIAMIKSLFVLKFLLTPCYFVHSALGVNKDFRLIRLSLPIKFHQKCLKKVGSKSLPWNCGWTCGSLCHHSNLFYTNGWNSLQLWEPGGNMMTRH